MSANLQHQHPLEPLNTLAVPAVAAHFLRARSVEQARHALRLAGNRQWPVLVLGGGSNLVLPDYYPGLVIQVAIGGIEVLAEDDEDAWLRVGAGENWQTLVDYSLESGYGGLENLSLIPGTVGAAPIQNIGAYGVELESVFHELRALCRRTFREVSFSAKDCRFRYRDSIFKGELKDHYVITSITLRLRKRPRLHVEYQPLREALAGVPVDALDPRQVSDAVCRIRRSRLPDPGVIPNAGSFFKNPVISRERFAELRRQYPELVSYPLDNGEVKLAAAWLLEAAGWRGYRRDGLGMHAGQALVLVNPGRRSGAAVLDFAGRIQADIQRRFGVHLEREPRAY